MRKVCIRCNPVSELLTDEAGQPYCHIHGKDYVAEEQPEPAVEQPQEQEESAQ